MRVILRIHRLKLKRRRLRALLPIAERIVRPRNSAKVDSKIPRCSNDAPVIVARDQDLTNADTPAGYLEGIAVRSSAQMDNLLLSEALDP